MRVEPPNELDQTRVEIPKQGSRPPGASPRPERPAPRWWIIVLGLAAAVALLISGIVPRKQAEAKLTQETERMAIPTVSVVHPKRSAPTDELVLPANVQAYIDSPIYARTNGYLKNWYVDIGARVKQGQLLAEIETPEVDQQLRQARADLGTAEANLKLAEITSNRYSGLLTTDSVSKQEADNAAGNYAALQATVQAGQANVRRLEELQSFQKIYAPFDGVITARNTDIGALIDAGSAGGTHTELFHIAQPDKLRVYVSVPQVYAPSAKPGLEADLIVSEFPGRRFPGTLVRTANAIEQTTRTLLVEIRVNNPTGILFSGAYAEAHLKLPNAGSSFILPVNALLFRSEGLRIAAVGSDSHVELKPITVGHDYGTEIEVVSGLEGQEAIIINPPDSIVSGEQVRVVSPAAGEPQSGQAGPQNQPGRDH
jgi:RND family efflux transporter MFP subunit